MITKYVFDSILNTPLKHIAHGVNCQNRMGSGVAKVLFDKYSEVKRKYHEYCNLMYEQRTESFLLGHIQSVYPVSLAHDLTIFNCFTQWEFGYDGKKYVNYWAIANCIRKISERGVTQLAIPKIGCGLAGGDWKVVEQVINDASGNMEVWVYEIDKSMKSGKNDIG